MLNAQEMEKVNEIVTRLFVATDQRDWSKVIELSAPEVEIDYSSMNGQPASVLSPSQITEGWKTLLPGFEHTHHQLGNFITTIDESRAHVFCYGTATHYLPDENGDIWTVVGSYDINLEKDQNDQWKITKVKFNFKYQSGNTSLPEKAMNRIKNS